MGKNNLYNVFKFSRLFLITEVWLFWFPVFVFLYRRKMSWISLILMLSFFCYVLYIQQCYNFLLFWKCWWPFFVLVRVVFSFLCCYELDEFVLCILYNFLHCFARVCSKHLTYIFPVSHHFEIWLYTFLCCCKGFRV